MEFSIKSTGPEKLRTDCLLVGVYEGRKLTDLGKSLDEASDKAITSALKSGDIEGKSGSTLLLRQLSGMAASRVLLVGLGKSEEFSLRTLRNAFRASIKSLPAGVESLATDFASLTIKKSDTQSKAAALAEIALESIYQVNAVKEKKAEPKALKQITLLVGKSDIDVAETGIKQGQSVGNGVALAKDLGNLPPNICTPTYLGKQAEKLAKDYGFKVEVLEEAEIEKLKMGSFLGVTRGSDEPPRFIVLQHLKGKKTQKPVVLVGKGITFDTGGISLKPGADMDEMKYDMCGAASVLGVFKAIGELDLPLNVVGLIPTCENMPSGRATKPGDVLTSMSGLTIEVLNTDAEGRLILCDALTYAERFEPSAVIDIATLTGACVIALGHHPSGLFANNDALARKLLDAGEKAQDRAWQMPLWDEYQGQLDSNFADMGNIGGRAGGSITAACFLSRFAKKYDWAHLDIAGTAWKSGKEKGATGRPVPLLVTYLLQQATEKA
ncbi:MAG TPA: leucyl aminopeptidase [Methylophilus sp.]|uniref:leucyl aminopeptidase n=1 Tax=Methylophilus sp. TaxID=29541 RepID=UPI002D175666|nr:leucyl aminopeptidase [Methylophilus sp.]HSH85838.1 leucyl aminopeptidase [Methylophilus sp.]